MAREVDLISAFISILLEKLVSDSLTSLARSVGFFSELEAIKNSLTDVQLGLTDAGEKSKSRLDVEEWLNKLQNLVYEIDDLLDDMAYEAMRTELRSNKITPRFFAKFIPHIYKHGHEMSSKLDEVKIRLDILVEEKIILGLIDDIGRHTETITRLGETSMADTSQSIFIGRDEDKAALLTRLLGNENRNQNFDVLSIVGIGGIGKTTLARVLYDDVKVKQHFELKAWVCVSGKFHVFKITIAIFQSVSWDTQTFTNLDMLQVALREKLSNKRFLLVLDDVWIEQGEKWDSLKCPFLVGAPGSKVIVTTRNSSTTKVMGSVHPYHMKELSTQDALSLFAQHALGVQNFDLHPELKSVAERIVIKCHGSPLALKAVGRLLRTKTNAEEWEELLTSDEWSFRDDGGIIAALKLSYDDLPNRLKLVFAYCSIFLKDYAFDKDELILLWMAEGFLYESNGLKSMENLGDEYFEELRSRSFFLPSAGEKSYKMHDLVHDLAENMAGERFVKLRDDFRYRRVDFEKVHHLSFNHQEFDLDHNFRDLLEFRRLQTLLAVSTELGGRQKSFLSNNVLIELLPQLQFLRVMNLCDYSITEIPQSIGTLKHLRYLNLSRTKISALPEQVGDLYNLQSLLLCGCKKLLSLPNTLVKLRNLRHLGISDTPRLKKIPSGIIELTSSRTQSKVIIDGANGFSLSQLKGLLNIQGQLSIEGLHNVINTIQATEAELEQKTGLYDLVMECNEKFEHQVLEALRPHDNLRNLKILFYGGVKFPNWVGDDSFVWLTELTLRGCRNCSCLPTLGHLKSLRKLFVESMNEVKIVGSELFWQPENFSHDNAFPLLEVLEFKNMQGWNEWSIDGGDRGRTTNSFPCLHEISILNCPKLSLVSIGSVPSLRVLRIKRCSKVVLESMVSVSSSIVRVTLENIKELTQFDVEVLEHFGAVEYLCVKRCDELVCLWELESVACKFLLNLENLEVQYCKSLISLGKKEGDSRISLKSVKRVDIRNCDRLERYSFPESIERFVISDCPSITGLTFVQVQEFQSDLKILDIQRCYNLGEEWLYNNFFSSVEYLEMGRLPRLKLNHEKCFSHLTRLVIRGCDNIESIPEDGFGFLPGLCLTSLQIISCMNLKSFPYKHLPGLSSLERLWISNCPNLESFPCGLWPPKLSNLTIGGLKNPMSEWKQQNFPDSLVTLHLHGENSGMVSFAGAEDARDTSNSTSSSFLLPTTLSFLELNGFSQLKSISHGLKHLSLDGLVIDSCPKLEDLPEERLPFLSSLKIYYCPKLQEKCHRKKGKYWNMISQIPEIYV
ncbi:Disease resistance protein [Artemisia annua]|uniref:Disease resistance protein n=1 Tax=Artemisia annua TaxID=35608 RepID=A0A2U1NFF8_ARTAN|nr:Disease resistance protein [Artemisia annua]